MPAFALANAGVRLTGEIDGPLLTPVTAGVMLGLIVGKPLGIVLFSWLAVRLRLAALPSATSWGFLHGAAWIGGIGFTMSLFIAALAFDGAMLAPAKIGILAGSALAGLVGIGVLRHECRRQSGSRDSAENTG
jgi:NhaA family Na+:H+ antiporter